MKCDPPTLTDSLEHPNEAPERSPPSSPSDRRVIFPYIHSEHGGDKSIDVREKVGVLISSSSDSDSSPEDKKEVASKPMVSLAAFPLQSPGLAPRNPRLYQELGLEVPFISLDSTAKMLPTEPHKASTKPNLLPRVAQTAKVNPSPTMEVRRSMSLGGACPPSQSPQPTAGYLSSRSASLNGAHWRSRLNRSRASTTESTKPHPASFLPAPEPSERLPSILRPSKRASPKTDTTSLDESSSHHVPALALIDLDSHSSNETLMSLSSRHDSSMSDMTRPNKPSVSFDPRVWVIEFQLTEEEREKAWFSPNELEHFRKQTIARLVAYNTELLPSGTGFVVKRSSLPSKAVFACPGMGTMTDDDCDDDEGQVETAVKREIQNILVVDPHDMCLKLFSKDFKKMIPGVNVCTAGSAEEAMTRIAKYKSFDVVVVEERLKLFHRHSHESFDELWKSSGSEFIKTLARDKKGLPKDDCLFVAVSAHLDRDRQNMQESGADFIWEKPPPQMDEILRDVLLKAILVKRGKRSEADKLFGGIIGKK